MVLPALSKQVPGTAGTAGRSTAQAALDDFDAEFTNSSVMAINVEHGDDLLQSDVERAVVMFAEGQDELARAFVENCVETYPARAGIRFWYLLFDMLQLAGDRLAFEQLAERFARACEMSPPTWSTARALPVAGKARQRLVLQGVLTSDDPVAMRPLAGAIAAGQALNLDASRLLGCDDPVAGQLASLLETARRKRMELTLEGFDALIVRLDERLRVGHREHEPQWCLLLELLQQLGVQAAFEERAIDYAVTFERSPPSWEEGAAIAAAGGPPRDVWYLAGDLKHCRFEDMPEYLAGCAQPIIDCSGLRRMDFYTAGQLVNRLAPLHAAGREAIIRSPNYLVAELMAVVGLNKLARIIVPKS